jgi:hypothetical protein
MRRHPELVQAGQELLVVERLDRCSLRGSGIVLHVFVLRLTGRIQRRLQRGGRPRALPEFLLKAIEAALTRAAGAAIGHAPLPPLFPPSGCRTMTCDRR